MKKLLFAAIVLTGFNAKSQINDTLCVGGHICLQKHFLIERKEGSFVYRGCGVSLTELMINLSQHNFSIRAIKEDEYLILKKHLNKAMNLND